MHLYKTVWHGINAEKCSSFSTEHDHLRSSKSKRIENCCCQSSLFVNHAVIELCGSAFRGVLDLKKAKWSLQLFVCFLPDFTKSNQKTALFPNEEEMHLFLHATLPKLDKRLLFKGKIQFGLWSCWRRQTDLPRESKLEKNRNFSTHKTL